MTLKVDFYILPQTKGRQALTTICQLVEKAYFAGEKIFIYTKNENDTIMLDQLLWTYKDTSFLPHELSHQAKKAPIQIGHQPSAMDFSLLINLSQCIPDYYIQFKRVMEIVFKDEVLQQSARLRFKQYRELGYELNTYKM